MRTKIKEYYYLTKPGLLYGNLFAVLGGYLYGAIMRPEITPLLGVVIGSWLVMACGTVLNNIHDRHMDSHMKRTKKRALVTGSITPKNAAVYAVALAAVGLYVLLITTNLLTAMLGVLGIVTYAGVYTYAKPRTVHATLLGTIPGALPPLAGYVAATNRIDASFWVLALIMACWQMVHFYAIAVYRQQDYAAAKVPVITVTQGMHTTKLLILLFTGGYLISLALLALIGYAGFMFLAIMMPLGVWWLFVAAAGLRAEDDVAWGKKVFFISLILLPTLCVALGLNAWMP